MERDVSIKTDGDFFHALVSREIKTLESILADDFVLIDLSGEVVGREGFMESLRTGDLRFEVVQPEDVSARIFGPTALVRGRTAMRGSFKSVPFEFNSRYTHIYVEQAGRCRMVAAQGTPIHG